MKTFSFLNWFTLVCLAFALMIVGNTVYAQTATLSITKDPSEPTDGYEVNKTVTVTFQTLLDGTKPATEQTLWISVHGGITATGYSATPKSVQTTDGEIEVEVRTVSPTPGIVRTEWRAHSFTQSVELKIKPLPPKVVEKVVERVERPDTSIVVLPPIPCSADYALLSNLVLSHLSENEIIERVGTKDVTPTSLEEFQTHKGLLAAIKPLRDDLGGLAARWDDMDPDADPADPTDMDSPPNTFRVPIVILNAKDLSGWQFDIAYNPQILEVIEVSGGNYAIYQGDFLEQGETMTFFSANEVNNAAGEIIRISQARIATGNEVNDTKADLVPQGSPGWAAEIADRKLDDSINGADGTGELVSICFRVKEFAEESLGLHNVQLSDSVGNRLNFTTIVHPIVVTHQFAPEDVNRDTVVNTKDLMVIAASLGLAKPINPRADVNNDGIVNALDLVIVAQHIMDRTPAVEVRERNMPAPAIPGSVEVLDLATIQGWIDMAHLEDDGSVIFDLGIANLEALLASETPSETKLLLNYPNPFNPETWIPYQLAEATEVNISIYAVNGNLIRSLALGHQAAGTYQNKSQAAYWDGRNELGERVASGVYFYTFTAGSFSATGKMLVRK